MLATLKVQLSAANKRNRGILNKHLVVSKNQTDLNAAFAYNNISNILMVDIENYNVNIAIQNTNTDICLCLIAE